MILAIYADPSLLNSVLFSHVSASFKDFNIVKSILHDALVKGLYTGRSRILVKSYLGEFVDLSGYDGDTVVLSNYLSGRQIENVKYYLEYGVSKFDKSTINIVFSCAVNNGYYEICSKILSETPYLISNANLVIYYHSQGDLLEGYKAMKDRDMVSCCKNIYGDRYIQSLSQLDRDESLLVLASWGVGDDIRFLSIVPKIIEKHSKVSFSCDPRLEEIFSIMYPEIKFIPSTRSKFVNRNNHSEFSLLPNKKLHHIMDNNLYLMSSEFDKVCLLTDLLTEVDLRNTSSPRIELSNITNLPRRLEFVEECLLRKESVNRYLIGICWRSMLQGATRNSHYFELDKILTEFCGKGVTIVILQYDLSCSEMEVIDEYSKFVDIIVPKIDQFNDFLSVLYLMTKLDCIISAGTAVLELAGISGKITYLLSNSAFQKYRFSDSTDVWFDNILSINEFWNLTKDELLSEIVDKSLSTIKKNENNE